MFIEKAEDESHSEIWL